MLSNDEVNKFKTIMADPETVDRAPLTIRSSDVEVRLAKNTQEVEAAQRLRYHVFYEERGAKPSSDISRMDVKRDTDKYDDIADHMIVVSKNENEGINGIVGTYRLLRQEIAEKHDGFYTSAEFDLGPILQHNLSSLELGRSCVLAEYRTKPVIQLLWSGISEYVMKNDIGLLFGCASIPGTKIDEISEQLAYLHHFHHAPDSFCPVALAELYVDMNLHDKDSINQRAVFSSLPPLFKGYLRIGCFIGDGAVIDHDFNTTDVCMILPMSLLTERYKKHYERKNRSTGPDRNGLSGKPENSLNE